MKNIYLLSVLIIVSCSRPIKIQYEINDNVSSEKTIINCAYIRDGKDSQGNKIYRAEFCDNDLEPFDYSPTIISQTIKAKPKNISRCSSDCPIGVSPKRKTPSFWDGDIYIEEREHQDISWVYSITGYPTLTKTEYKNQLTTVENKFNIKLYPPMEGSPGFVIGTPNNLYNFYISDYSKHSQSQALAKVCEKSAKVTNRINISTRVSPQSANALIAFEFPDYSWAKGLHYYCEGTPNYYPPVLDIRPIISDGLSDFGDIKVTIDINKKNYNLDNLYEPYAKKRDKNSFGYCVYKQSGRAKYHRVTARDISRCRTTCYENEMNSNFTSILDVIPAKFQYSVSANSIYRGEYDKNDLHKDESGRMISYGMFVSSFSCPDS